MADEAAAAQNSIDERWLGHALALAASAEAAGEVPVGAVLVRDDRVLAEAWNRPIANSDPTAHAEILALRSAAASLGNYRLPGATMYVTLEPCAMCAGAMIHARIARLVFGAYDTKSGACGGVIDVTGCKALNHQIAVAGGVLEHECAQSLRAFFKARRSG